MPISNKSSQKRMTQTTIRVNSDDELKKQQTQKNKRTTVISNNNYNNDYQSNTYRTAETPPLYRNPSPTITRGNPRMFRVQRVSRAPQIEQTPPREEITTKTTAIKDTMSRGTTPPPPSFYDRFPADQSVYLPTSYETRVRQPVSTVRYRTPTPQIHQTVGGGTTTTRSEVIVQQPQTNASTTTKTSTRILDATTIASLDNDEIIEETKTTTTIIKPIEIPTAPAIISSTVTTVPPVTTVAPIVETTTIRERPTYRTHRRRRIRSTSTFSDYTTSSTSSYTTTSTVTPRHHIIRPPLILPPRPPIQTTIINDPPATIVPERRFVHRARRIRTHSGYYSSDLDFGKRKIYKSDYKYRHYYYCNWCKGRCDLPNSSCGCCEWFYGCPVWGLILLGLLFLALIITFFTLLGLQPTINSARYSETAQTRVLNRTQIVYGFLQNCGASSASLTTTLVLCANTPLTTTSKTVVTSYYTLSKGIKTSFNIKLLILFNIFIFLLVN